MNITFQILTAIALWCSVPVNSTKGSLGVKTGSDRSLKEIQTCRENIVKCINNTPFFESFDKCFMAEKLVKE